MKMSIQPYVPVNEAQKGGSSNLNQPVSSSIQTSMSLSSAEILFCTVYHLYKLNRLGRGCTNVI